MKIDAMMAKMGAEARCDPNTLELLFKWYGKTVYQTAFFILKDRALAEDIVQETFLTAYIKLDCLQHPDRIEAWLAHIALHKACDLAREHRRLVPVPEPAIPERMEFNLILNLVIDREAAGEIKEVILHLPALYKEVLFFKYSRELTTRQIAEALEIPEGTVKSRLNKAKTLITKELGVKREGRGAACYPKNS